MSKQECPEPSITTAPRGDSGDSSGRDDTKRCSTDAGGGTSGSADPSILALASDIKAFEKNRQLFMRNLHLRVRSGKRLQMIWYAKLRDAWKKSPPATPLDATKLVLNVLDSAVIGKPAHLVDLYGILDYYKLPQYSKLIKEKRRIAGSLDDDKDVSDDEDLKHLPSIFLDEDELYSYERPPSHSETDEE